MKWFYQPENTFQMWHMSHLSALFLIILILIFLYVMRKNITPYRRKIRLAVGWTLLISRVSLDIWYLTTNQWTIQSSLPLELCSIASIASAIMLLTKNKNLFEVFYFIGIGGAIQAIFTPDLDFGFPQYRFIQFFLDHFLLLLAPLLMIWLYQFRITIKSLIKSFAILNVIAALVFLFNTFFEANYMFLKQKPIGGSLLDFLGPYPYYLLSLEIVVLIIFFILYIPFYQKQST